MNRSSNLLDEALGLEDLYKSPTPLAGRVILIEDCVETSGAFVLHHLIKRCLSSPSSGIIVIFVAFSQSFSHYERILRKLGCNLVVQRDGNSFYFIDMNMLESPGRGENYEDVVVTLYGKIQKLVEGISESRRNRVFIMIDDLSVLEVAANGSLNHVLNFLHYCNTLTSEFDCSLVLLNHDDIYSSMKKPTLKLQMEYCTNILIKAEPIASGLANDIHGQLTVLNRGKCDGQGSLMNKRCNFHFRIKENNVEYFYAGSQS